MKLTLKQEQAILSTARYKVLNFGRRSGKTTELAYEAFGTALSKDNAKITYYAQTFGDARDIAWNIFLNIFGKAVLKKNETLLEITLKNTKGGTSKVSLKGWESVVTGDKGRGTENDLILIDEVAFLRGFQYYWNTVLEPTLLTTNGRAVFSSTPNGFNDFYHLAQDANHKPDWYYLHATSYDNPHNSKEWLDDKRNTLPPDIFAQEYMADFRKQQGLVFKEFDRNLHIYTDEKYQDVAYLGGVDFGFKNPSAIAHIHRDKKGHYWISGEYYEREKTDAEIAEVVAAIRFNKVYPDPENQGAIKELRNRNVNVCHVEKGKGSIRAGIQKIRELLKQCRLHIHASCVNTIWEIEAYHYPLNVKTEKEELPVHENCHLIDAIRYVLLMDDAGMEYARKSDIDSWFQVSKPRELKNMAR